MSEEDILQQKLSFNALLQQLGNAPSSEIVAALTERETIPLDPGIDANTIELLQQKIQKATKATAKTGDDA